jgi:DNA-binding NarL/FixJ family response regulator
MFALLADDDPKVRSALKLLLEHEKDVMVVGEVADTGMLVSRARDLLPDLVLLDWELPGVRSQTLIAALRSTGPGVRVVALSGRPEARQEALVAGVDAFVSKGDPPQTLLSVLCAHDS